MRCRRDMSRLLAALAKVPALGELNTMILRCVEARSMSKSSSIAQSFHSDVSIARPKCSSE